MARIRTHPGEVLREEFLMPLAMTPAELADEIGLPSSLISSLLRGRRSMSADIALRLARRFGTTPQLWLNLQNACDLSKAESLNDYSAIKPRDVAA